MAERDPMLQQMFEGVARPQLSPFFEAQLRKRLAEQRQQRLVRRCGRVMAVYWLLVGLTSSGILFLLPWPAFTVSGPLQIALLLVLVSAVAPVWVLLRAFRTGFIDTIVGTFETV